MDIYAAAGTTGLLLKVLSLPDMVLLWRVHAIPVPLRTACLLDRVALLRDCVLDLADEDHELEKRFGKLSPDAFLPWGIRLANLLEELLGFRKEGSVLYLRPVLPASWDSVHIAYRYRSATYRFHLSSACTAPVLDGEPLAGGRILLQDDGRIHEATRGSAP